MMGTEAAVGPYNWIRYDSRYRNESGKVAKSEML